MWILHTKSRYMRYCCRITNLSTYCFMLYCINGVLYSNLVSWQCRLRMDLLEFVFSKIKL